MEYLRARRRSPFLKVILFSVVANVIQTLAFYAAKDLNNTSFALLNFGFYVIGLAGIFVDAVYRWLLMMVSSIKADQRFAVLYRALTRSMTAICSVVALIIIAVYIYSNPDASQSLVIVLAGVNVAIGVLAIYPRSLIISEERFVLSGTLDLIAPIFRLLLTILVLNNSNVPLLFAGLCGATILNIIILYAYLLKRSAKNSRDIVFGGNKESEIVRTFTIRSVVSNATVQIAIAAFYISDGVILKSLLSDFDYGMYVSYAYVYKFPLFVSLAMLPILLGKDFSDGDRKEVKQTLKKAMYIIFASFSVLFMIDAVSEGWLLKILGYSRFIQPGLSFVFGLSWMAHTMNYFLFSYLIKVESKSRSVGIQALLYAIVYVSVLIIFSGDLARMLMMSLVVAVACIAVIIWRIRRLGRLDMSGN